MTDEVQAKRGDAAWKEQREAIARRNADAQKKAQAEQRSKESVIDGRIREHSAREREQLSELNARLGEQNARRPG